MMESQGFFFFFLDSVNLLLTTKQELITSIYLQIFKVDRIFLSPLHQPVSASYYLQERSVQLLFSTSAYAIPFGEPNLVKIHSSKTALVNIYIDRLPF